jgi:hypothetical protein
MRLAEVLCIDPGHPIVLGAYQKMDHRRDEGSICNQVHGDNEATEWKRL